MKDRKKGFHVLLGAALFSACLHSLDPVIAKAGDINSNEWAVVNEVSSTFEYEGKTYRASDDYIELTKAYLSMDEYDLTKEQCDQVIAKVRASVAEGIANGYLYEVTGEEEQDVEDSSQTTKDADTDSEGKTTQNDTDTSKGDEEAAKQKEDAAKSEQMGSNENSTAEKQTNQDSNEKADLTSENQQSSDRDEREDTAGEAIKEMLQSEKGETTSDENSSDENPSDHKASGGNQAETVIKNTGFSIERTILTGGVLMSVLLMNGMVAGKISRIRKNDEHVH